MIFEATCAKNLFKINAKQNIRTTMQIFLSDYVEVSILMDVHSSRHAHMSTQHLQYL